MFQIEEELKKLPAKPGVYIMHDKNDTIIYVGKAIILRNRVRSYFRDSTQKSPKIQKMVSLIDHFEYIVTDSEVEALVLENNLIKENKPKYNTMLKDDKTYPYIKVTIGEEYPRVLFTREMKKDRAKYYGPFPGGDGGSVRDTVELINDLFGLRTCNRKLPLEIGKDRACLNAHIHRCSAPCDGSISMEEYRKSVEKAIHFLNGNFTEKAKELEQKMQEASENMEFEEAIRYRDLLAGVNMLTKRQKITDSEGEDRDVIAMARGEDDAVVQVFFVRNGKLIGREHYYMTQTGGVEDSQVLSDFIKQFYAGTPFIPKELMLQHEIEDSELIANWLKEIRGSKVYFRIPQKGQKEKLVELACENARIVLTKEKEKIKMEEARCSGAVEELRQLLNLAYLERMEAFDISNISGFENVGSMVVYEKGKPKRSDYRKFRIKSVAGPNDYACMNEVLMRRFQHGLEEKKTGGMESSFTRFPDVLLMDGGRGQVNIAERVLSELGINIPVCGMVKDDNHRTRGLFYHNIELPIEKNSEAFRLLTRIQDEAHRFAIEYHRSLRNKKQVFSALDTIPGIGPARRKALMKAFASIEEIRTADEDTLKKADGMNAASARAVYEYFHKIKEQESPEPKKESEG